MALDIVGPGERGVRLALEITRRWSFVLFWISYTGPAIAQLKVREPIGGDGRKFCLSFAAAHLVHIGLIVRLSHLLGYIALSGGSLLFFLITVAWTYLLATLSFLDANPIGRQAWQIIRFSGMNWILLAFGRDFVVPLLDPNPLTDTLGGFIACAPFAAMLVGAPLLALRVKLKPHKQLDAVIRVPK
jgi:hypothetical protein